MTIARTLLLAGSVASAAVLAPARSFAQEPAVDLASLLHEMSDLGALARLPEPDHRTTQFSSYDRRSTSPDAPGWFANADGFGEEPIPDFLAVLEAPGADGVGRYLVAEVEGPGAIVRGWSAGMDGTMEVTLDGADTPLFRGTGRDFLSERSRVFFAQAGVDLDARNAFRQEDADYFPVPFARSLRVTWQGKLEELHFYHLEVRHYPAGTRVAAFDPASLAALRPQLERTVLALTQPRVPEGEAWTAESTIAPGATWSALPTDSIGPGALTEVSLRLRSQDLDRSLRGTVLRIAFDASERPQVDAPVGDFFGAGPGLSPYESLPMRVGADGWMTCRFPMPYAERVRLSLWNTQDLPVRVELRCRRAPWNFDERSLHFRAKWRVDHDLDLDSGAIDLPYVFVQGQGRFVGAACSVVNPGTVPHPSGSWWGEGDEKILVDGESFPSFFGTGSEDYYNYSWSRPDLFAHPYCAQPQNTGPGNQGFCSDLRWHVLDSVSFHTSFVFAMELKHHRPKPGLGYSRIAYLYARPGAYDDHRRIQASELALPTLPHLAPEAVRGSNGATFRPFGDLPTTLDGGTLSRDPRQQTASRGELVAWTAAAGDRVRFRFSVESAGPFWFHVVASHWPDGGTLRATLDGTPLSTDGLGGAEFGTRGSADWVLRSRTALRLLDTSFGRHELSAGDHELEFECTETGRFGFDYLWWN